VLRLSAVHPLTDWKARPANCGLPSAVRGLFCGLPSAVRGLFCGLPSAGHIRLFVPHSLTVLLTELQGLFLPDRMVTVQPCIKTVVFVLARSVLCDEAIPRWSIWPDKLGDCFARKRLAMTWLSSYAKERKKTTAGRHGGDMQACGGGTPGIPVKGRAGVCLVLYPESRQNSLK
jgi:hypothetical protein